MLVKNPFAKPTAQIEPPASVPAGPQMSAANDPSRSLKRWQLESGRTAKRREEVAAQLDAARRVYIEADQRLGAQVYDGKDLAEAEAAWQQAAETVRRLEGALRIAMQRDEEAQAKLKHAEAEVRREVSRENLAQLVAKAQAIDHWMDSGKSLFEAYASQRKTVLEFGDEGLSLQIQQANLAFQTYLFRTCAPMAGCQTGYAVFQTDEKWSAPWSRMNPQPEMADAPRPEPREPKPIPGWKIGD